MPKEDTIKTKLEITGEKDYRDACKGINETLRLMSSEMKLISASFADNASGIDALTAKQATLQGTLAAQTEKVQAAEAALKALKEAGYEGSSEFTRMEIALNTAQAAMVKTQNELGSVTRELDAAQGSTKGYTDKVAEIDQTLGLLGAELRMVSAEYDASGKSTEGAKAKKEVLSRTLEEQQTKVRALSMAYEKTTKDSGAMSDEAMALKKSLLEAKTGAYETESKIKELGRTTDEAKDKTSIFGDVLKASLAADAIKAGLSAIVDGIKSVTAAVTDYISVGQRMADDATQSQTLLTQVMRNTMSATDDTVQSMIDLAKAQENIGVVSQTAQVTALAELASFVERKEALEDMLPVMNDYIAYQYGTTASQDQARNVATALGKAIQGNIDGLAKQGFQLTDSEKQWFKTAEEAERVAFIMDMVSESMDGVNKALAQTDAGKMARFDNVLQSTQQSVGMLANSFKAQILGEMLPSVESLSNAFLGLISGGGSIDDVAGAITGVIDGVIDVIQTQIPEIIAIGGQVLAALIQGITDNADRILGGVFMVIGMLVEVVSSLLPTVLDAGVKILFSIIDGIISALPSVVGAAVQLVQTLGRGIADALPAMLPKIVEIVTGIVNMLIEALPMVEVALDIITALADGLMVAVPALVDAVPQIITSLVRALIEAIPMILDTGIDLLTSIVGGLPDIIAGIVGALPEIINAIIAAVLGAVPLVIYAGIDLLVSLVDALPEIITTVVEAIPAIIEGIITAVLGAIPLIIQAGFDLLIALVKALPEIVITIVQAVPQIITGILGALIDAIPDLIMAGVNLFVSLIENLPVIIVEIVKAIPQIAKSIFDAFTGFVPQMMEMGKNLLMGLKDGMLSAVAAVVNAAIEVAGKVIDGIKDFLGISSPSRVFAEIGGYMAEGVGIGFADEAGSVERSMAGAMGSAGELTALEAIRAVANGIVSNVSQLDQAVRAVVERIRAGLAAENQRYHDQGQEYDRQLAAGKISGIPHILSVIPQITQAIVTAYVAQHQRLAQVGVDFDRQLAAGMISGIPDITSQVPQIMQAILSSMQSFNSSFVAVGEDIVRGIWGGFQNLRGWLFDNVRSFMNALVDEIRAIFAIASPSKVFAEIGRFMAEGLGVGFSSEMRNVEHSIRRATSSVIPKAPRTLGSGTSPGGFSITQIIRTAETNYAAQQREATKQFRMVAREVLA